MRQRVGLGLEFLLDVERAYQTIRDAPDRWAQFTPQTRRYRVRQFPYYVVYEVQPVLVLVVAVTHTSRRPGYWEGRLP